MNVFNLSPVISQGGSFKASLKTNQKQMVGDMGIVNATSNNYNDLANKPSINGVTLIGDKTSEELKITGDKTYIHTQALAASVWEVEHNLDKYPSVTVVDSGNSVVIGEVVYIDSNNIRITFTSAFSGKAYFN